LALNQQPLREQYVFVHRVCIALGHTSVSLHAQCKWSLFTAVRLLPKVSPTHGQPTVQTIMTNASWVFGFQWDDSDSCELGDINEDQNSVLNNVSGQGVFSLWRVNKALLCPILLYFRKKAFLFCKVPRLRPFVFLVKATCRRMECGAVVQ
jgi:hypothetical protein